MSSDTPLYDETLSDVLLRVRRQAEARAQAGVEAVRATAAAQVAQARADAERARLAAERAVVEAEQARRVAGVRRALRADGVAAEAETREPAAMELEPKEDAPQAPPVPSMADLMEPGRGAGVFFDALLGPTGSGGPQQQR